VASDFTVPAVLANPVFTPTPATPAAPAPVPPTGWQVDVLKAYKFEVELVHPRPSEQIDTVGLMEVTGLRDSPQPGKLILSRGVVPANDPVLHKWWRTSFGPNAAQDAGLRDIYVTVDKGVEFRVKDAKPTDFTFNDLDAGGDSRYVLIEYLVVEYKWISVKYLAQ
jgi:hypothetical protein